MVVRKTSSLGGPTFKTPPKNTVFCSTSAGIEVWDPSTGTVKTLLEKNPFEVGTAYFYDSQVKIINQGTELILFGGRLANTSKNEIWKYNIASNTWVKLSVSMQKARAGHLVLEMPFGFSCP